MKEMIPAYASAITPLFAIAFNILFVFLCMLAAFIDTSNPLLIVSVSFLFLFNGLVHCASAFFCKKYTPGLITAVILFLPLSLSNILMSTATLSEIVFACFLGVGYQVAPLAYLRLKNG